MIIQGDILSMCPSNQISDKEYEELLQKYEYNFQKGDLVKGTICTYDSEGAIVDIGAKTNAICPEKEAKLNKDDNIEETNEDCILYRNHLLASRTTLPICFLV